MTPSSNKSWAVSKPRVTQRLTLERSTLKSFPVRHRAEFEKQLIEPDQLPGRHALTALLAPPKADDGPLLSRSSRVDNGSQRLVLLARLSVLSFVLMARGKT
jgi:hypothetical protein